ncbi:uncharacterized protein LOC124436045 [Xenia sp. Carnegie-2017]|uniref:uncharacterized protein LOC124436045 n=1 Tax=Xenia sp. Carnegie-2017 TaxID=2897299 RepID=UPI001F038E9C|nr:uncharacterized protein LOC124436045 [Xenia sp. Carnegie-2017]
MLMEQSIVGEWKWNETYPNILEAAKETLGVSRGGKYIEKESWWWNEEVQEAVKNKKEAFKRWKRSGLEEDRETLREMNKISKEKCAIVREKGSALSPLLFIIIMDVISDDTTEDTPWSMLFADDLVLCDEKREHLEGRLEDWRRILKDVGLKVSRPKTEYLLPSG